MKARRSPLEYEEDKATLDYAETLAKADTALCGCAGDRIKKNRGVKMQFGMPTLIETNTLEECADL